MLSGKDDDNSAFDMVLCFRKSPPCINAPDKQACTFVDKIPHWNICFQRYDPRFGATCI